MAQKFTTGITVRDLASAASDAVAVSVAGDTNDRIKFEAGGKVVWGSGASAGDVNLYRDAADRLKTDDALQADGGLITVTTAGTPTLSLPDGALAIDTVNNLLYIRTNSVWEIASGGGASVTTSDGAPADPEDGDLWYETDTGSMFVYYDDGASQQWVEVGTAGVIAMTTSDTAPSTPANGDLWFDTSTAKTYVYYDDGSSQQWVEVGAASAAASGQDGYIQFATGGTFNSASALVWDNDNNELEVTGTVIADALTVDTSTLHVDSTNNRVGIGTATPGYPLDVVGDVNVSQSITSEGLTVQGSATVASDLTVDTNTLHVDSTNNRVGIGTTTPTYTLDAQGQVQVGGGDNITPDASGNGHLMIDGAGYSGFASLDGTAMWVGHNSGSRSLYLATDETARVTVTGGGNVGINDTTPSYKLDVNGDINATGDVRVAGNPVGMVLVKSQTIGSGVSSVTVSNCFSSAFSNYRIVAHYSVFSSNNNTVWFRLSGSSANYYGLMNFDVFTGTKYTDYYNNGSGLGTGITTTTAGSSGSTFDLMGPFNSSLHTPVFGSHYGNGYMGTFQGALANFTSSSGFTIYPNSGTITGGIIRVYGYNDG